MVKDELEEEMEGGSEGKNARREEGGGKGRKQERQASELGKEKEGRHTRTPSFSILAVYRRGLRTRSVNPLTPESLFHHHLTTAKQEGRTNNRPH